MKNRYTEIMPLYSPIVSAQQEQFALCTFWAVPIWTCGFSTVTCIRQDSRYILEGHRIPEKMSQTKRPRYGLIALPSQMSQGG